MTELESRRDEIEGQFSSLESYWGFDVPEALGDNDWSEDAMIIFCEEARGIPAEKYRVLLRLISEEFGEEYSARLSELDALIKKHEPGLKKLLGFDDPS